jgi:hypothetical protein
VTVVGRANRLFCDGGTIGSNPSSHGAPFAWCFVTEEDEIVLTGDGLLVPTAEGLPLYQQRPWYVTYVLPEFAETGYTNNLSEAAALYDALRFMPDGWSGTIISDSDVTLGRFFRGWNWRTTKTSAGVPEAWMRDWQQHRARLGHLEPMLVAGHPTDHDLWVGEKRGLPVSKFNRLVDKMCGNVIEGYRALGGAR